MVFETSGLISDGGMRLSVDYCGEAAASNARVLRRVLRWVEVFMSEWARCLAEG